MDFTFEMLLGKYKKSKLVLQVRLVPMCNVIHFREVQQHLNSTTTRNFSNSIQNNYVPQNKNFCWKFSLLSEVFE